MQTILSIALMQKSISTILLPVFAAVAVLMMDCTKPDRSEEEQKLKEELQKIAFTTPDKAFDRIDSAERVGLFSPATANLIRTNFYGQMGQTRLAIFYGEQILNVPELKREGASYYSALLMLGGWLERNAEYGKVLCLCDEIIADVEHEREQGGGTSGISAEVALRVKSRALTLKGSCELNMDHPDKAEQYFLEAINIMLDGVTHTDDYWVIDPLFIAIGETTEFYLGQGMPQKALKLVAIGDTALARQERCKELPEYVYQIRHNNITINQAMIYAANGQFDKAEALYQKHRQSENLKVYDLGAEARYLSMLGSYDEAVRLFLQADSLYLAQGGSITTEYIKYYMMNQYETLQKAGRKDEAQALSDRMRQLADSIHIQERKIDVKQQEEIRQKELEIANRRQSLIIHRIILGAAILICLLIVYFLWRFHQRNKALLEKNRRLLAEIEQREQEQQQSIEQLKAEPQENLTSEQQLFRRICDLMESPDRIYTDADLDRSRLAQLLGTNEHYVTDAISTCTNGKSVNIFLNEYRLRYATRLLATTKDSISLIAELSGFSRSSFFRIFSDAYGMSPSDYRKAARK
ncbi:AraC-type DNA-binding protein [Prevotella communis]|uniref:AraC-type DNA-binding protein n=2 Tax=Prevotella communis TaxID=2913614 RepID=A0A1H0IID6_9BACT|nr:AraC-type DNA-binding protein [Prevotella communis]SDO31217.1 AraC-type DNA-binding protein [Prevotella communis]